MKDNVQTELENRLNQLRAIYADAAGRIKKYPEGSLVINNSREFPQYYHNVLNRLSGKNKRIYLGKKDAELIKELAQKSFDRDILNEAERQIRAIEAFLENYNPFALREIYSSLHPARKPLVAAAFLDKEL